MTPKAKTTYGKRFNALGRFVGLLFLVVGVICFFSAMAQDDAVGTVFAAIVAALGVLLLYAKPYRPDLRDSVSPESPDDSRDAT